MKNDQPQFGPNHGRFFGLLLLVLGLILPSLLSAQTAVVGSITGHVQNIGNGKSLGNVRVTIVGTDREAFSDDFGVYRLNDVPAGEVKLSAFYTGLDTETATVTVTAGMAAQHDFNLTSRERYGDDKTVTLDTFVVAASREFEANAIATNEQRFSPNIKNVVAADAFGDVTEGNVGEFLKYLPGITVDYVAADVRTVSVRGFAAQFTNVSVDGMRLTSAVSGNTSRSFEFEQASINNMSRVEVTKVPTPDSPADSLGGTINMISKNAFERKGAQVNYRAYFNGSNEDLQMFSKTPGPGIKNTYKVLPGFDFDATLPFNKNFGIVVTGLSSNQFNEQHRWSPTWNYAQAGATVTNPYLQSFQDQDGPKNTYRDTISAKADWKISDQSTLSLMVQENYYNSFFGNRNINFNLGTTSVPTPATGTALTYGPTFVTSATGRAAVTQSSSFRDKFGNTTASNLVYRFNGQKWDISASVHGAESRSWYRDLGKGHWSAVSTALQGVSTVAVTNIAFPTFDWVANSAVGTPIDYNNLNNYRLTTTRTQELDGKATLYGTVVDAKRDFDGLSFPLAVKVGVASRTEAKDYRRKQSDYTFLGADGVANTADDAAGPYLDTKYNGVDPYWGKPPTQYANPYVLADLFNTHPEYFRQGTGTTATGVQAEKYRIQNSQKVQERVDAAYFQVETKLLDNKLQIVTGVRFEQTSDDGAGGLTHGNPTTLAAIASTWVERGYKASKSYDGYYPGFHATYEIRPNLLARFAYAQTVGRPDYSTIVPTLRINDTNASVNDGIGDIPAFTVIASNTGLKPWTANNYDLSLEYYFKKGGMVSVGAFDKEISDFWGNTASTITQTEIDNYALDASTLGYTLQTQTNVGAARIRGLEFNFTRPLDFLPSYGKYLSLSVNGTKLFLTGSNDADFNNFIPVAANASLSWNKKPVSLRVTYNYRGRQRGATAGVSALQTGTAYGATAAIAQANGFYEYYAPRYNIDVNAEYTYSKRLKFFFNARNITNTPQIIQRYSDNSPVYSYGYRQEEFAIQMSAGIKGSF